MMLTRKQGNEIKVDCSTQIGSINGIGIDAEDLERWAYRRLETWPELLGVLKLVLDVALLEIPCYEQAESFQKANNLIARVEG